MIEASLQVGTDNGYIWQSSRWLSRSFHRSLSLSLSLLQRMASNNDGKRKMEEEAESSTARKRVRLSDDDSSNDDYSESSDSLERELEEEATEEDDEEEVSSEEMLMNQLDTFEEKLHATRAHDIPFSDDGGTSSMLSKPRTPESHRCSDEESSVDNDDDDDF
jgi:hypothetical protein